MKIEDTSTPAQDAVNPEEAVAEKHVTEIMGPAQPLDGSKLPEEMKPTTYSPTPPPVAEPVEPVTSAPELGIDELNKELAAQVEAVAQPEVPVDVEGQSTPPDTAEAASDEQQSIDTAVDDILRTDADNALPPELDIEPPVVMKESFLEKVKEGYFKWWDNRVARYSTFGVLALLIAVVGFVPVVRASVLNTLGVRTSVSVTAIDSSTTLPLKNVVLSATGVQVKTNADGYAKLYGVKLGKQDVLVHKAGFADVKKSVSFSMRTVDLGEINLKAVGTQYTFMFSDYFSGSSVKDVGVSSGEATTKSDKTGKAILTVPPSDDNKIAIVIEKQGYRTEKLNIAADASKPTAVKLVPAQKEIFISKESGKYDLYKMDLDGQNKEVLLAGTGLETPALNVLVDPAGKRAALVSTRDDKRNKDGYLLSALTLVDIDTGESEVIEHAEQITLIGWSGTTLVYQQTVADVSAANANRNKIVSYDYIASKRLQLANANYFSGSVLTGDKLYYVVSSTDPSVQGSFARINVDATNKKQLFSGEIWQLYRSDYKTLKFQTPDKWYEYKLGNAAVADSTPPASFTSRKYLDSPDGKTSVWVDERDASGALIAYNVADGKEHQVTMQRGLTEAMRWVNEQVVVYRTVSSNEVIEYAISLNGGEAHRLSTVSALYQR